MKLGNDHQKVLAALIDGYSDYEGFCYSSFDRICAETKLDRKQVRRSCRFLTRKGFAQFGRGLWTENGDPAGSGYAATNSGRELVESILNKS